jgi:hypothetical protein
MQATFGLRQEMSIYTMAGKQNSISEEGAGTSAAPVHQQKYRRW